MQATPMSNNVRSLQISSLVRRLLLIQIGGNNVQRDLCI